MCTAAPDCAPGSPLPPIVTRPATKSVGCFGIGSGRQRSWFGVAGASSNGALRIRPGPRPHPIRPAAPHRRARRREARAVDLLGIEAVLRLLRIALADGQGAGQRFAREVVAEAGLIATLLFRHASRAVEVTRGIVNRGRRRVRYSSS